MSESPEYEDGIVSFADKSPFLTMMSGGIFISIFLYFVFSKITENSSYPGSNILPIGIVVVIITLSVIRGRQIDGLIKINIKTGWVYGSNRVLFWEGYIHETKNMIVLQRERTINEDLSQVEYKLLLELDDNTKFEIPLNPNLAEKAIEAVDKAKSAVPVKRD